jgi:hypothetical protein
MFKYLGTVFITIFGLLAGLYGYFWLIQTLKEI